MERDQPDQTQEQEECEEKDAGSDEQRLLETVIGDIYKPGQSENH